MTKHIGIGVIGMGWMGQVHSRSYLQIPQRFAESGIKPRLVICSDNVAMRAESAQEMLNFDQSTTSWQEVIEHPEVSVVNVAAPNDLHLEIIRAAASAGKHIFCEKPVGRFPQETAEIEAITREAGVLTFVGFNYRWAPLVQHAHMLVQNGMLGDITHFRGRFFSMYGSDPLGLLTWRFDAETAGLGVTGDIMSHAVDMALWLAGPISRLTSTSHIFIKERPLLVPGKGTHYDVGKPDDPKGMVTNEDYVGALVEFQNGARGTLEASRTPPGPKSQLAFEMNGTKGALSWDFERMNELQVYLPGENEQLDGFARLLGGPQYPYHGSFNPGEGLGIGYEDLKVIEAYRFLESVKDGNQGQPGLKEALAVAEVHAAMIRSWKSGQWEDVTPIPVAKVEP